MEFLKTTIEFLKGVGPARQKFSPKEARIFTFNDLLHYFPFRYVDRSVFHKIVDVPGQSSEVQLKELLEKSRGWRAKKKKTCCST